ncbi:MAG: CHAD domain-containing protein [Terracidiphilus sp.]|nr:CHAD domain-containing protein [Terracidiphilus sp.]
MSAVVLPLCGHEEPPSGQDWQQKLERWCERLDACAHKPSPRRVHGLRAATLRLQAELDACLLSSRVSPSAGLAAQRWSRKAQRVRKQLSTLRDIDVCLDLLATFPRPETDKASLVPPNARDYLRAIEQLERTLRRRRATAGKRTVKALDAQRSRIEAAARAIAQALSETAAVRMDHNAPLHALVRDLVSAVPGLTSATLHGFRKLAKTGRYLAERTPQPDAWTQEVASQCKAIQTTVGHWRDWATLAEYAKQRPSRGAGRDFACELQETAARLLDEALRQCRIAVAALADRERSSPARRPVQRVHAAAARRSA